MKCTICEIMDVELLGEDELLVELELRMKNPRITPKIKSALTERLRQERLKPFIKPRWQHRAARERPDQEFAICKSKMRAIQQYLLQSIYAGVSVDKMLFWVGTKMRHVDGRINRVEECEVPDENVEELIDICSFLWEITFLLDEGFIPLYEVADKLTQLRIKVVEPMGEPEEVNCKEARVEVVASVADGEEVEVRVPVEAEGEFGNLDGEAEEEPFLPNDQAEAVKGEPDCKEVREPEGDKVKSKDEGEEVIVVGEVKIVDEVEGVVESGLGYPEEEYPVVPVKPSSKTTNGSTSKAQNSRRRGWQDASANVRSSRLRCACNITQFCAWSRRHAVRILTAVDRLLGVLDLRLEDEVLAKANRRVFRENVSGFSRFVE